MNSALNSYLVSLKRRCGAKNPKGPSYDNANRVSQVRPVSSTTATRTLL